MTSPFFRDQSFSPAQSSGSGGLGSGTKELSYAGLSAGTESGLGVAGAAPMSGHEAATAAAVKASAEASALAGKALLGKTAAIGQAALGNAAIGQAAVGNAAIANAAIAPMVPGGEPVSPLIQLIMRMPGAMGMATSFFEWLAHMFAPGGHDLLSGLGDLHLDLAGHVAGLEHAGGLLEVGEHFTVSLTSLPGDAPIMQGLQNAGSQLGGIDKAFSAGGISEHFMQNPANIGAGPDLGHAQFEQAASSSIDGALSGPAVSGSSSSGFLAGNQRLFSDSLGGGGQFNSITSNTSVPVTGSAINGATSGSMPQNMSQMQSAPSTAASGSPDAGFAKAASAPSDAGVSVAQNAPVSSDYTTAQQSVGPSSFGERYADNNLIASDSTGYHPSANSYQGGQSGGDVAPLKARQLTFEDVRKGVVGDHGKQLIDQIAGKHSQSALEHPAFQARFGSPRLASTTGISSHVSAGHSGSTLNDGAGHQAHSTASHSTHTAHSSHNLAHAETHSHQAPTARAEGSSNSAAGDDALKGAGQDQTQIAQSGDAAAANYTVHRGDSLWNIAQKQLGDGSRWSEIYKMNSDLVGQNPDLIFSGTQLKLPGGADQMMSDASKYVVKPGDNLWSIAKDHMGNPAKWSDIYKSNMGTIGGNPRLIMPGQQLSLPGANPTIAQMPTGGAPTTVASAAPSPTGMDATQSVQTAPQMSIQQPSVMEPQMIQAPQAPVSGVESGMASAGDSMLKVAPTQPLTAGSGAAGAATLRSAGNGLVSNSLKPDLSFLEKRTRF